MKIKGIIFEDTVNYCKISLTIMMPVCSFKCDKECGQQVCQNSTLDNEPIIDISLYKRFRGLFYDTFLKNMKT